MPTLAALRAPSPPRRLSKPHACSCFLAPATLLALLLLLALPAGSSAAAAARSLHAQASTLSPAQLATWMTSMWPSISSRQIQNVWIPGSHDTFTYDLGSTATAASCGNQALAELITSPVTGKVSRQWAVAQISDVSTQLNRGVRYLDIRPYYRSSTNSPAQDIWIQHCAITNSPLSTYLTQIGSWLASNPSSKEVLLLHFKAYTGAWDSTAYAALASVINQTLGTYLVGSPSSTGALTLAQIVGAGGPKVLAVMEPNDSALAATVPGANRLMAYSSFMSRSYANVDTVSELIAASNGYVTHRPANQVLVLEGVLTEQFKDIASKLIGRGVEDMKSLLLYWEQGALHTTNSLLEHTWNTWTKGPGMIIMLDNPHAVDSDFIISLNVAAKAPAKFTYGECSAKWLITCHTKWSSCAAGYSAKNKYSGLLCTCTCCKGDDCGCGTGQMDVCN